MITSGPSEPFLDMHQSRKTLNGITLKLVGKDKKYSMHRRKNGALGAFQRAPDRLAGEKGFGHNPRIQSNDWNPYDRELDGGWEINCGAGVCRDLPHLSCHTLTEHYACDCDLGYAEVVVGGTHKTCPNNCSVANEVAEGESCKDVNECVLSGGH